VQFQEMADQMRDVVAAIAEYRNRKRQYIEAVEQVLPKQLGFDALAQVRIRGGNDADVGENAPGRAQRPIFILLQESQDLDLCRRTQGIDFVQEQAPPFGLRQEALLRSGSIRECPFHMPEQLVFKK